MCRRRRRGTSSRTKPRRRSRSSAAGGAGAQRASARIHPLPPGAPPEPARAAETGAPGLKRRGAEAAKSRPNRRRLLQTTPAQNEGEVERTIRATLDARGRRSESNRLPRAERRRAHAVRHGEELHRSGRGGGSTRRISCSRRTWPTRLRRSPLSSAASSSRLPTALKPRISQHSRGHVFILRPVSHYACCGTPLAPPVDNLVLPAPCGKTNNLPSRPACALREAERRPPTCRFSASNPPVTNFHSYPHVNILRLT